MEWVETTGRTVEEAKEAALDQLGVAEDDAEFEIVEEPRVGLFGRLRNEARVRARVRPATPRSKDDRRDRRRRRERRPEGAASDAATTPDRVPRESTNAERATASAPRSRGARPERSEQRPARAADESADEDGDERMDVPLLEQAEVARGFLLGLARE